MKIFNLVVFLLVVGQQVVAQVKNAVTVKFIGLSIHPKKSPYPEIFKNRLDKNGYFVVDYGLLAGYERFFYKDIFSVRVQQGFYADCAAQFAGFSHIGWRGRILKIGNHSLNGGIGPTLVYRKDWNRLEGYTDDGYFKRHASWQYKFLWYGGEFEYNYLVKDKGEFSVMFVPGFPEVVTLGVGWRQWF
ncbi:MAG: hypothetical protein LPJ89_04135 [Hymenobacteraceae bacterium]|nr:hypothetical protein [Hymenobacteraceae bacterium]MDX5395979.1 hypothetical protein [Hymenobacteraceae bacterium]MDX5442953.1 hypothetical protein [Hymenobacteraceae bacterium]MDX5512040.1 hypothetical protein [Hymenobacteraceae bacterium]